MYDYAVWITLTTDSYLLRNGTNYWRYFIVNWQTARSVTAGNFDKCLHFLSIFIAWNISIVLIIPYVPLNITGKIISKPNIFSGTQTQDSFRVCHLGSCNLLAETNKFCLGAVLPSCLFSELQKASSSGLETRTVFSVLWPLFLQSTRRYKQFWSRRRSSVVLSFRATGKIFAGNRTQDSFLGSWSFFLYFSLWNKQLWSWRRSSIVLSFRTKRTALTGNWTHDIFPEFWPCCVLFLVSRNKHPKFDANRFIRYRAISEHTYIQTYIPTISTLCIRRQN
jgi:hypothetical protein